MGSTRMRRKGRKISINGKKLDEIISRSTETKDSLSAKTGHDKNPQFISDCIRSNTINPYDCMIVLGILETKPSEIDADFSVFGWNNVELVSSEVEEQIGEQRSFDFIEEDDGRISRDDLIEGLNNSYLAINDEQKKQTKGIYMIYNLLKEKL